MDSPPQEINLISCGPMAHISDIKLIRTDTTLDLSQKAEKGMNWTTLDFSFYNLSKHRSSLAYSMWDMNILENLNGTWTEIIWFIWALKEIFWFLWASNSLSQFVLFGWLPSHSLGKSRDMMLLRLGYDLQAQTKAFVIITKH